ncbi:hypothetical protein MBANPS3_012460, partial [Mucor bainieri]
MHIFVTPDATAAAEDKLYQLRSFIDAYNENLQEVVIPGKYVCVDEFNNQWLSHGMPYLKKIPRKPHSIGQEYKTTADVNTCCIIRLDVSGDKQKKEFDSLYPKTVATVLRLVKPWFHSGRTVIADSWFGSPAIMIRAVISRGGLYSIMQVKKKRYWPKNIMPVDDMVLSLGSAYDSVHIMKSMTNPLFVAPLRDKKPKCVIANCSSTSTDSSVKRWIDGRMEHFTRPIAFD